MDTMSCDGMSDSFSLLQTHTPASTHGVDTSSSHSCLQETAVSRTSHAPCHHWFAHQFWTLNQRVTDDVKDFLHATSKEDRAAGQV
eukprot:m.176458 g.176458  ORF g.176458 m.176458 type:complete len:86 (-) comp17942_c0_seq9:909-1166(-)